MAPRQPVDDHRPLGGEERPRLAHHLLVGRPHPVRVQHALRDAGRAGREQDLRDRVGAQRGEGVGDLLGRCARREPGQPLGARAAAGADDRRHVAKRVQGRPEALRILGEHRTGTDQLGDRPDPGVVTALQRVGHADRGHRNAGGHRAEHHEQVIDAVAGQHHQRPVGAQAPLEQGLADRLGGGDGRAVAAGAPRPAGAALGDERIVRVVCRPRPHAVQDAGRVVPQRIGGAQQHASVRPLLPGDARRREQRYAWFGSHDPLPPSPAVNQPL